MGGVSGMHFGFEEPAQKSNFSIVMKFFSQWPNVLLVLSSYLPWQLQLETIICNPDTRISDNGSTVTFELK